MKKPGTEDERTCRCGNKITPYVIGEKQYWMAFCLDCIARMDAEDKAKDDGAKIIDLGLYRRYVDADFDTLHEPKPSQAILEAIKLYANDVASEATPSGRGLYLWGPNGTGKTHLAVAVARRAKEAFFVNSLHLIDELKLSFNTKAPCRVYEQSRHVRLLVLDDLGSERPTGWVQERLYALVNTRWDEMLPTMYTSNHSPQDLEEIVGTRSASRILGTCLAIKIDGPDHRRFSCATL